MADRMSEIDEVAKSSLTFVDGDDVGLDGNGSNDDGEQEILCSGACVFGAACAID